MVKHILLFVLLALPALAHAQDLDQSGFISIDCGIAENSRYTDATTRIDYVSDENYIDTGVNQNISPVSKTDGLEQQFFNLRSFPNGKKNCYTLTPQKKNGANYLVRARFMYGNYDNKNRAPTFDLYLGVNYWDTVEFENASVPVTKEILHVPSSNYTYVCLVNIDFGIPFISVLELRLVNDSIYKPQFGSLALSGRYDIRSSDNRKIIRYVDDIFDRVWGPSLFPYNYGVTELRTSLTIDSKYQSGDFSVPFAVMGTAITPQNASDPLEFNWNLADPTAKYYLYFHFADLQSTQLREFYIYLNDEVWGVGPIQPQFLATYTVFSGVPEDPATWFNFSFRKTPNSTLPPILNAIEIYIQKDLSRPQTNQDDVDAILSIKSAYGVEKNWQGDPCSPQAYSWEGLNCFNDSFDPPRIISLNLSLSGLRGSISPSIFNLKMLQSLDLSSNSLTGEVPDFLTQMTKLTVLNLTGNNLTGIVPAELIKKSRNRSLSLSLEGNPYLCESESCEIKPKKKNNIVVPIVASVAAVFVLLIALVILWMLILKRKKQQQRQQQPQPQPEKQPQRQQVASVTTEPAARGSPLKSKQQQFTYSDVLKITRNFQRVLGKGGFGTVFHGYLDNNTQVAVKMLSPTSEQGYKHFRAEAELLMRVHHRNLTSLVGYCDEGDKLGLIYEYMANGDLQRHLSDRNIECLSWETRLSISLDTAQGLEYLHTGSTPPMIHRDMKPSNILLNEQYLAKLADFGLSKVFPVGETHVSTTFAGTLGYYGPELKSNEKNDVFSFGVVLLEIITGRPAIVRNEENTHISQWVSHMLKTKGDVRDVVDPRLGTNLDLNSVWKAVDIAMECVSAASSARPTMNHVAMELKRCLSMERAAMKKGYGSESTNDSDDLGFPNIHSIALNPRTR